MGMGTCGNGVGTGWYSGDGVRMGTDTVGQLEMGINFCLSVALYLGRPVIAEMSLTYFAQV